MELPKYKCHKEVWALKISKIDHLTDVGDSFVKQAPASSLVLHFEDKRYAPIEVDLRYALKHNPREGGYYVVYKDGYESFSPASEFEDGYTLIK